MARKPGIAHIDVQFKGKTTGKVRDASGRYIPRETRELRQEFMELAHRAQAEVLARMATRFVRQPTVTGRLEKVTADRRNRVYTDQGFGVGVERFLDRSEAKYWRTIEYGSKATWKSGGMIGLELRGKFGGAMLGWRTSSWGTRPIGGAPWGASPGFFMPLRKLPPMIVKKEIDPMYAYADAYEDAGIFDKEAPEVVMEYVRRIARASLTGDE